MILLRSREFSSKAQKALRKKWEMQQIIEDNNGRTEFSKDRLALANSRANRVAKESAKAVKTVTPKAPQTPTPNVPAVVSKQAPKNAETIGSKLLLGEKAPNIKVNKGATLAKRLGKVGKWAVPGAIVAGGAIYAGNKLAGKRKKDQSSEEDN